MARIVRVSELKASAPGERRVGGIVPDLVVEIGTARISVRPGFDRTALAAVLEVLTSGTRGAR